MNPAEQQPLRVRIQGVTDKMLNIFQYFFRDPCNEYCEIVNDESADLTIIDLDGIEGRRLVDEHQQKHPQRSLIVFSIHPQQIDNAIFLQKPLKPEQLMNALEIVNQTIQSRKQSGEDRLHKQTDALAGRAAEKQSDSIREDAEISEIRNNPDLSVDILLETTGETLAVKAELPPVNETSEESDILNEPEIPQENEILEESKIQEVVETSEESEIPKVNEIPVIAENSKNLESPMETTRADQDKADEPEKPGAAVRSEPAMPNTRDERGYIGTAPDIDPNDPVQLARAEYNTEDYFQHFVQQAVIKAVKYRRSVLLTMPHGSLVVLSDGKTALLDIKESRLRAFCSVPITDETLTIIVLEESALLEYHKIATPIALEQLVWKAAIWASRGRVPAGTNLHNLVYFQEWPNISRSLLFPNALRIAAFWVEKPCSLIETAKALEIPQRYVFAFYSASNAIGIAFVRSSANNDQSKSRKIKKARDRNMLDRLLNRLHGAKRKINGGKS